MKNKKLSDFSALLFDLDGTLTNDRNGIPTETINCLNQLDKLGYQIGICTGRGTAAIKNKILPIFPKKSFHITTGGSQLVNSKGEIIYDHPINPLTVEIIKNYLSESNALAVFMKADAQYADEPLYSKMKNHPWNYVVKKLDQMSNERVGAVFITKLNNEIVNYIENNPNLSYKEMVGNNSGKPYIDVTAKGVNKSTLLHKWSEKTQIPMEKVIGFGDSLNDLEFLQSCGFSVSMENAIETLKQITDKVIGNVNENGIAEYLLKIIQGKDL
ncbi:MAG: Cof-type HAD-IIB family hydrolase [Pseudomonadales bacterium]|nr:Cof-type HAD-IIB family hydrolase [Pseudomonadales bacterium]